jgi:hypothetical protein
MRSLRTSDIVAGTWMSDNKLRGGWGEDPALAIFLAASEKLPPRLLQ